VANDTIDGRAAYFLASDHRRVWRVADALEYGMVGMPLPFGGWKQSGIGREGPRNGLEDYLEMKYFHLAGL
jgi:succinate-semialdehyde dehydrogenase/glutarate-semialdehyde dehydrogenase